jgi:putative heme-binding domain-containing protein
MTMMVALIALIVFSGQVVEAQQTEKGQAIFQGKGVCENCHRVRGRGSRLGPDLSEIGSQREPAELRQSILHPDADILPQNRFYYVMKQDGSTVTGRLLNHDTFTVQLMSPKEELLRFRKAELRDHGFQRNSPMPSYEGKLTAEELSDLIAYLVSLRSINK